MKIFFAVFSIFSCLFAFSQGPRLNYKLSTGFDQIIRQTANLNQHFEIGTQPIEFVLGINYKDAATNGNQKRNTNPINKALFTYKGDKLQGFGLNLGVRKCVSSPAKIARLLIGMEYSHFFSNLTFFEFQYTEKNGLYHYQENRYKEKMHLRQLDLEASVQMGQRLFVEFSVGASIHLTKISPEISEFRNYTTNELDYMRNGILPFLKFRIGYTLYKGK